LFRVEEGLSAVPGTCVIGLQWGDEAKGKLVDILTEDHEIVVRYAGGANAGHTVVSGGQTWKLSLIPSGILRDGITCVVAGGVVLDPASFIREIEGLEARAPRLPLASGGGSYPRREPVGR
jgi:adenylosuccinate synthase